MDESALDRDLLAQYLQEKLDAALLVLHMSKGQPALFAPGHEPPCNGHFLPLERLELVEQRLHAAGIKPANQKLVPVFRYFAARAAAFFAVWKGILMF